MSKKKFKKYTQLCSVSIEYSRYKRVNGEISSTPLYKIYGPQWMQRD